MEIRTMYEHGRVCIEQRPGFDFEGDYWVLAVAVEARAANPDKGIDEGRWHWHDVGVFRRLDSVFSSMHLCTVERFFADDDEREKISEWRESLKRKGRA